MYVLSHVTRTLVGSLEEGQRAAALVEGYPEMVGVFLEVGHYSAVPGARGLSLDLQELSLRAENHLAE